MFWSVSVWHNCSMIHSHHILWEKVEWSPRCLRLEVAEGGSPAVHLQLLITRQSTAKSCSRPGKPTQLFFVTICHTTQATKTKFSECSQLEGKGRHPAQAFCFIWRLATQEKLKLKKFFFHSCARHTPQKANVSRKYWNCLCRHIHNNAEHNFTQDFLLLLLTQHPNVLCCTKLHPQK